MRIIRAGLLVTAASLIVSPPASASDTIGGAYGSSGGIGCGSGNTYIQTSFPGNAYAAPYDGVIVSWGSAGFAQSASFKVARLGSGSSYTIVGSDGPRTSVNDVFSSYPTRIPVRQGDAIGLYTNGPSNCFYPGGAGAVMGTDQNSEVPVGSTGSFDLTSDKQVPVQAEIERDRDGDGYGDETQDACPTNGSTQGPCPLPTTLGETFTPITQRDTGTAIPALPSDGRFIAPADGVITSWSYAANNLVDGTAKLKAVRPLGGDGFQVVAESVPSAPTANTLNTFATRLSVRAGDRVGIRSNNLPIASSVSASGSSWFSPSDPAPGASTTFIQTNRRINVSAVLEADADNDGYGDTSQDLCPTDPSTQGQCPVSGPPDDSACGKAKRKLEKAKAKLKKLKKKDAAAKKVKAAKATVKKAKKAVKKAC